MFLACAGPVRNPSLSGKRAGKRGRAAPSNSERWGAVRGGAGSRGVTRATRGVEGGGVPSAVRRPDNGGGSADGRNEPLGAQTHH